MMRKSFFFVFMVVTASAFVQQCVPKRSQAMRMSWQPNEDFNSFGRSNSLTDFERSAREAGATDRKVTIRKPLGLILDEDANKDVYVKEVVKGGNADALGSVKEGDLVRFF